MSSFLNTVVYNGQRLVPSKIICVGRNYVEHIRELQNDFPDELVLFIKPNSSISETLRLPSEKCRYEGEICFLIQSGQIAGAAVGLDLTLPEVQNRLKAEGLPWEKAKAFDNSAVFSDFVDITSVEELRLELWVNGELKQAAPVELMIQKPAEILKEISRWFTLSDGDIVMTGTPAGVGDLTQGDRVSGKLFLGEQLLSAKEWTVI